MSEEDAFLNAIAADPSDATVMLVFADWLAERDDPREHGYRWLAKSGRRPQRDEMGRAGLIAEAQGCWEWWYEREGTTEELDRIPMAMMVLMKCDYPWRAGDELWSLDYLTCREAIEAAANAFHLLPPEIQESMMNAGVICGQA